MRNQSFFLVLFVCFTYGVVSCQSLNYEKETGGIRFKIIHSKQKNAEAVLPGYSIKMRVQVKVGDSVVTSFNKGPFIYQAIPAPHVHEGQQGHDDDPIMRIIKRLKAGDSVVINQPMDSIPNIKANVPSYKPGDMIVYNLKIYNVYKTDSLMKMDQQQEQKQLNEKEIAFIEQHLSKNKIKATKMPEGYFLEKLEEGTGSVPGANSMACIYYTGKLFNGEIFDSNVRGGEKPGAATFDFKLGAQQVIPGFEIPIKNMHVGEKVRVYLPSFLGYGARGAGGAIKPFTPLVFEIRLVAVK